VTRHGTQSKESRDDTQSLVNRQADIRPGTGSAGLFFDTASDQRSVCVLCIRQVWILCGD